MTTTLNASTAGAGGFIATSDNSGILALQTAGTTAITVDASQNVGIGTSSPAAKLDVAGDIRSSNYFQLSSGSDTKYYGVGNALSGIYASTDLAIWNVSAGNTVFYQNGAERMRIDSNGVLLVNTTTAAFAGRMKLNFAGVTQNGILIESDTASASGSMLFKNTNGIVGNITTTSSSTAFSTSSDYRLKENIAPMTGALAKIAQLKPVTYKWKIDGADGEGFIAHELAEVKPHAVIGEKDAVDADGNPKYQGIDTSFLVATLTAALQETKALIDTQAATINALTARIVALENK